VLEVEKYKVLLTTKTQLRYRATQRVPGMYSVSEIKIKHKPFVKALGVLCVLVVRLFFIFLKDASAFFLGGLTREG
jgi:hypothetical protein